MVEGLQVQSDPAAAAEQIKNLYHTFTNCDCTMVEVGVARRAVLRHASLHCRWPLLCACRRTWHWCHAANRSAVLVKDARLRAAPHMMVCVVHR